MSVRLIVLFLIGLSHLGAETALDAGFSSPPQESKPRTWLHAMSGNMSKVGMTKDLEAVSAAGLGGVLLFNVATGIPYGDVPYHSDKHHEIIAHGAEECERLGLSFGVHNCDGWSSSGGPWITPAQSMKVLSWSETVVQGGGEVSQKLAQPTIRENFYREIGVVAYPAFATEVADAAASQIVTASSPDLDIPRVTDGRIDQSSKIEVSKGSDAWILFDYGKPHTIRSAYASFFTRGGGASLQVSADGKNFREVIADLATVRTSKTEWNIDDQFDPITARFFRFKLKKSLTLNEISLSATRGFDRFLTYTGYGRVDTGDATPFKVPERDQVINPERVLDLSDFLKADGTLEAVLPPGDWTVMRFGYTSSGATNTPASKWGRGLECDKFSRPAYKAHFDEFCQRVIDESKPVAPNALQYIEIDSYEMGGQNWTDGFEKIFKQEKGYELLPFLPIFAGRYVDSAETVLGVTYDLNDLYCELMTKNYFGYFTELCHENGLQSYVEPYGDGPVSTLDISGHIDLPMTEFWMGRPQHHLPGTVSGAHIYGKKVISAESFTSTSEINWKMHPAMAKTSGDKAWAGGVNEFMFHRFVHQSNPHVKPGVTMGKWGSHIDRTQTWWMNAGKAWFEYIARGSFLLRQGYPVADVLVFVGDGPHKGAISREHLEPQIPAGLNYDCRNSDVLLNRIKIEEGGLVLPEGNVYRYLVLKDLAMVSLETLRRINEIAQSGVPVIGTRPERLAGYLNSSEDQAEFEKLVEATWARPNCVTTFDFSGVLSDFKVIDQELDFMHRRDGDTNIFFFHHEGEEPVKYECQFRVSGQIPERWDVRTGKKTKLARFQDDGEMTTVWLDLRPAEAVFIIFRESSEGVVSIVNEVLAAEAELSDSGDLLLTAADPEAFQIALSDGTRRELSSAVIPEPVVLNEAWKVAFSSDGEIVHEETFDRLTDWKDHAAETVKYFAGTATYTKVLEMSVVDPKNYLYILDLGEVDIAAEVFVNGRRIETLWIEPFRIEIGQDLRVGENELEIRVTNQWSNKLIGDERFPRTDEFKRTGYYPHPESRMPDWFLAEEPMPQGKRTTFCTYSFYSKGDDLLPSGLKGPVSLSTQKITRIKVR